MNLILVAIRSFHFLRSQITKKLWVPVQTNRTMPRLHSTFNISDPASSSLFQRRLQKYLEFRWSRQSPIQDCPIFTDMLIPRVYSSMHSIFGRPTSIHGGGNLRLSGSSSNIKMLREKYDNSPGSFVFIDARTDIHVVSDFWSFFSRTSREHCPSQ